MTDAGYVAHFVEPDGMLAVLIADPEFFGQTGNKRKYNNNEQTLSLNNNISLLGYHLSNVSNVVTCSKYLLKLTFQT